MTLQPSMSQTELFPAGDDVIDFYTFATVRGDFSSEGLLNDQDAIDTARSLGERGETVLAIFKGGQLWLKEDSLKKALMTVTAEHSTRRRSEIT